CSSRATTLTFCGPERRPITFTSWVRTRSSCATARSWPSRTQARRRPRAESTLSLSLERTTNMDHQPCTPPFCRQSVAAKVALVPAVVALAAAPAVAQEPLLWGGLKPGPHAVGFKSLWQLDYSRRYNMTFDDKTTYAPGKAPRPILVNVWYPASKAGDAKRMSHRGYLEIQSADPLLAKFSTRLAEYARGIIAKEVMAKPAK